MIGVACITANPVSQSATLDQVTLQPYHPHWASYYPSPVPLRIVGWVGYNCHKWKL